MNKLIQEINAYHSDSNGKVYHRDCADILPMLREQADLVLTSPPYGNVREYGGHGFDFQGIAGTLADAVKPGGVLVWVVGDTAIDGVKSGTPMKQAMAFMELGLDLYDTMIYEKSSAMPRPRRYSSAWEYMFVLSKGRPSTVNLLRDKPNIWKGKWRTSHHASGRDRDGGRKHRPVDGGYTYPDIGVRNNIWRYSVGMNHSAPDFAGAHAHPAIFPLALATDHIRTWTNVGDMVVDPMAGSGTTLRAAMNLDRQYIGIEIEESYLDIISGRMAQQALHLEWNSE